MFVGASATSRYLDDRARGAGIELDVPVGGPVTLLSGPMQARDLVAGVLDIGVTEGDPVRVSVLSIADDSDLRTLPQTEELAGDGKLRRGEYRLSSPGPSPIVSALTVGAGEPAPVTVGSLATAATNLRPGGRPLAGDYGVLRALDLTLANPTASAAAVYLYEVPIGYPVTTSMYFDGDPAPLRVRCVKTAAKRYLVRAFGVAPGTTERITGAYMTDGASTYPLTFGLTTDPPPAPPATMTGPDGCYSKVTAATPEP